MANKKRSLTIAEATKPVTGARSASLQAWHDAQTRQAIKEADAGDSATAEELKETIRKYVPHA